MVSGHCAILHEHVISVRTLFKPEKNEKKKFTCTDTMTTSCKRRDEQIVNEKVPNCPDSLSVISFLCCFVFLFFFLNAITSFDPWAYYQLYVQLVLISRLQIYLYCNKNTNINIHLPNSTTTTKKVKMKHKILIPYMLLFP